MAKKYKIVFDRSKCIGAGACVAMNSNNFEMDDDGKAKLLNSRKKEDKFIVTVKAKDEILEARDACPVEVIKVFDAETGEEIE